MSRVKYFILGTSMIIGPPRLTDLNATNDGVFLSISQPMVPSQPFTRKRFTRQMPFSVFGMRNWPVEFDHLELPKGFFLKKTYGVELFGVKVIPICDFRTE